MKNNRIVIIYILIFVLLIGGAGFLYNALTKNLQMDSFVVTNTSAETESSIPKNNAEESESSSVRDNSIENEVSASQNNSMENESSAAEKSDNNEDTQQLQAAPDFTVYDASGNQVNLSDYLGKPVILNFWASWCGPCKSEMPGFENMYKKYGDQIQFLMINLTDGTTETVESASSFISDNGYTFPVFYDTDTDGAYTYGISSIPTTYLINTEGEVAAYAIGAVSESALENAIGMILE